MRLIQFFLRLLLLILAGVGLVNAWEWFKASGYIHPSGAKVSHAVMLREMTEMGNLELVRYQFTDVVEHEIIKQWLPNPKAALIVQGEAIGCIDLSQIKPGDISLSNNRLIVQLPPPQICVLKIDHEKSKILSTEYSFLDAGNLVDDAYRHAEVKLRESALTSDILDQTKLNARKLLTPILEKSSGKEVVVTFGMDQKLDKLR